LHLFFVLTRGESDQVIVGVVSRSANTKAAAAGRTVSAEVDTRILALLACVRKLEKQAGHIKRRHRQDGSAAEQEENE
jgi:hypothetical protein